jgi:Tfp pilus assembly protein PilN
VIEVNLLPGGKKRAARGKRRSFALPKLGGFAQDRWVVGVAAAAIGAVMFGGWLWYSLQGRSEEIAVRLEAALADSARYSEQMGRTTSLLSARDSIVKRVAVIQEIDQGRYVWPHLMDEISRAIPDYIWMLQLQQITGGPRPHMRLIGQAGSIEALTVFMDQLESSPFITSVRTIGTTQVLNQNQMVYRYELELDFEQPPAEFLETVPLLDSQPEAIGAATPGL